MKKIMVEERNLAYRDILRKCGESAAHAIDTYTGYIELRKVNTEELSDIIKSNTKDKNFDLEKIKSIAFRYIVANHFIQKSKIVVDGWIFNDYLDLLNKI